MSAWLGCEWPLFQLLLSSQSLPFLSYGQLLIESTTHTLLSWLSLLCAGTLEGHVLCSLLSALKR